MRFKADLDGTVTGVRFYKATANTGSHIGNLWTANGTLLATGTFSGESATGWQQLTFTTPVDITAGTTYVASYFAPRGHYSTTSAYFYMPSPTGGNTADTSPLHALSANGGGANGVYSYGGESTFPNSTYNGENYAVDVVFTPKLPPGPVSNVSATAGTGSATVNFSAPVTGGPPTRYIVTPFIGSTAQPTVTATGSPPATSVKVSNLDAGTAYTFRVQAGNGSGISALSAPSNAVTPTPPTAPGAPTALIPSAGNQQATLRWTAPNDGGATITRYTITPYLNGVAQATTQVTGLAGAGDRGRDRADQRLELHVHGDRHQLGRHRSSLGRVERRHAERRAALHPARLRALDQRADPPADADLEPHGRATGWS